MSVGPYAPPLIQVFENCLKPIGSGQFITYYCPAKVLSMGYGTTRDDVPSLQPGDIWSKQKCEEVFARSLPKYDAFLDDDVAIRARNGHKSLTAYQRDALISGLYNAGPALLSGNIGRALREGRDKDMPEFLSRWNKGGGRILPGLVRRRKAEGQLWSGDIKGAQATAQTILPGSMPQSREVPTPTTGELARRTTREGAAAAGGGATSGGTVATKPAGTPTSSAEMALIVGGLVVFVIGAVLIARKVSMLKKDWH